MLFFSSNLKMLFNIVNAYVFPVIGGSLLFFAVFVWYVASKKLTNKILVTTITVLDLLWVLVSLIIVNFGLFDLTKEGNIIIIIVAIWIGFLAYKQFKSSEHLSNEKAPNR